MTGKCHVIAGDLTWIEGEAVHQLRNQAALPGVHEIIGMPDLHPGKGSPIGIAMASGLIYAGSVGSDIGCGMAFWETDFPVRRAKPDRLASKLDKHDHPWDGDTLAFLSERNVAPTLFDTSLGTPGFSNHFIEIQQLVKIYDEEIANQLKLNPDNIYVMCHSGSRGFGEKIFIDHAAKHGADGLTADSPDGLAYIKAHDHAVAWARANRDLCAIRVLEALNVSGRRILDITHNSVTPYRYDGCACWLHRKGAAPADQGPIIIPGSRDDLSFLVQPLDLSQALASLAHGAGRKIARKEAHGKLERLYPNRDNLKRNQWGGQVVCGDKPLLWEEAKECYKDIMTVINDLETAGLIKVIASLRPIVTFKSSEIAREEQRQSRETWQRERSKARSEKRRDV
jgi:release factor H-coupled RctB family protein